MLGSLSRGLAGLPRAVVTAIGAWWHPPETREETIDLILGQTLPHPTDPVPTPTPIHPTTPDDDQGIRSDASTIEPRR